MSPSAALPRVVIAAPGSGHGKTTVTIGIIAALRRRGLVVAPAKIGPDYIDPGYHTLAAGRPGRNLDPFLVGEERIVPLLLHGAATPDPSDVAVIEGVMGLYDGRLGTDGFASTAHVATLTASPIVLVIDVRHASRTVGALVRGLASYDDSVNLAAVILNHVGSPRHEAEVRRALVGSGIDVLGALPRDPAISAPSRHLGLVPAEERPESRAALEALADHVVDRVNLDGLLALARSAPDLVAEPWDPAVALAACGRAAVAGAAVAGAAVAGAAVAGAAAAHQGTAVDVPRRPIVAVAGGRAFTFRYPETEELLRAAGCEPVVIDPLTARRLPANTAGLYLGGGFPEVHAAELTANTSLRADVAAAVRAGMPTVAECAGLLYLCRTVDGIPMTGALPLAAAMTPKLTLGYREAVAPTNTLLAEAGERVTGHEFHRTQLVELPTGTAAAWSLDGLEDGISLDGEAFACSGSGRVHASYLHVHWAGHPRLAARFAAAVHAYGAELAAVPVEGQVAVPVVVAVPVTGPVVGAVVVPVVGAVVVAVPGVGSTDETGTLGVALSPGATLPSSASSAPGGAPVPSKSVPTSAATARPVPASELVDLAHHGDRDVAPGLVDLAVNVRPPRTPALLVRAVTADADWAAYPDAAPLRAALAAHHGVTPAEVLPTAGGAEAFTLIARALTPKTPVVVHPQFTEPEAALAAAGHRVRRQLLRAQNGFRLRPEALADDADLVVVGNPTNPTSVLHPRWCINALRRPGRVVVVDEAFMDAVPGEAESLIQPDRLRGVLVIRSLTKTWGIAGLRVGYVVGDADLIRRLAAQQPPWSVSTPAIRAALAILTPEARRIADADSLRLPADRADLVGRLEALGLAVVPAAQGPFVLVDTSALSPGSVRAELAARGFAVRRGETFPGLGPTWIRLAVRDPATHQALAGALASIRWTPDA